MITRQRGDQRRRKSHVYISTVCLFVCLFRITDLHFEQLLSRMTRKNARGEWCSRVTRTGKREKRGTCTKQSLNHALLAQHKNL